MSSEYICFGILIFLFGFIWGGVVARKIFGEPDERSKD